MPSQRHRFRPGLELTLGQRFVSPGRAFTPSFPSYLPESPFPQQQRPASQKTRYISSKLYQCWANVYEDGLALSQRWVIDSCFLGYSKVYHQQHPTWWHGIIHADDNHCVVEYTSNRLWESAHPPNGYQRRYHLDIRGLPLPQSHPSIWYKFVQLYTI